MEAETPTPRRILPPPHWPRVHYEDRQLHELARFEAELRRGKVPPVPECFREVA